MIVVDYQIIKIKYYEKVNHDSCFFDVWNYVDSSSNNTEKGQYEI